MVNNATFNNISAISLFEMRFDQSKNIDTHMTIIQMDNERTK